MADRTIQHAQFLYYIETPYTDPETQEEGVRLSRRIAMNGETVDIPRQEDLDRGDEGGAFYDPENHPEQLGDDAAEDADAANAAEAGDTPDIDADHDTLVNWIQNERPNEDEMVAAAQNDPGMAQALMDAEQEASGGDPRKGVMTRLKALT